MYLPLSQYQHSLLGSIQAAPTLPFKLYLISMKSILFLSSILLFSTLAYSQTEIPKGAEAITVTTSLTDSLLFEKAVSAFDEAGFTVTRADIKRGTIVTDNKKTSGLLEMRILATVRSSVITIKGQWSGQAMGYSFPNEPVIYKPGGGNVKKSFLVLNELAEKIKSDTGTATIDYVLQVKK